MKIFSAMNFHGKISKSHASTIRHSHRALHSALLVVVLLAALPLAAQDNKDSGTQQSSSE